MIRLKNSQLKQVSGGSAEFTEIGGSPAIIVTGDSIYHLKNFDFKSHLLCFHDECSADVFNAATTFPLECPGTNNAQVTISAQKTNDGAVYFLNVL